MNPAQSIPSLEIRLFGRLKVHVHGQPIRPFRTRKSASLLARLVLAHGRPVGRQVLADQLWPNSEATQARNNLRRSLTDLRNALGLEAWRLSTPPEDRIRLDLVGAEVDLITYDRQIDAVNLADVATAVALYRAPLLKEHTEEWIYPEREQRCNQYMGALERLADFALRHGDTAKALRYLQQVIDLESLRESAVQRLLRAYQMRREFEAAVAFYHRFRVRFFHMFGEEPAPETEAAYHAVRMEAKRQEEVPLSKGAEEDTTASRTGFIPPSPVRLIGRREELWESLLRLESTRLLTLMGPGGVGKSRLAIGIAETVAADYPDGVWVVDLSAVQNTTQLLSEISLLLDVTAQAGISLTTLQRALAPKHLLLVLDNAEHLIHDCAHLAGNLLQVCPEVRILVTSRQALRLTREVLYPLQGLPLPPAFSEREAAETETAPEIWLQGLLAYAGIQLYLERARQAAPDFVLDQQNARSIVRICRYFEGLPLALELAASWTNALTPQEMARRLNHSLDMLQQGGAPVASRHQTMRSALDSSYTLLSDPEKLLWRLLSAFAGGVSLTAIEGLYAAVRCGTSTPSEVVTLLRLLVDKSLVVFRGHAGEDRYHLLETIREYGCEKLTQAPEAAPARSFHMTYFTARAEEAEAYLLGTEQATWLQRLERERDNLRLALSYAVQEPNAELGLRLAGALWRYWSIRGYYQEGYDWLKQVIALAPDAPVPLRIKAMSGAGNLAYQRTEYREANAWYAQALQLAQSSNDHKKIAALLGSQANVASVEGLLQRARELFEQSLALFTEMEDAHGISLTLGNLAIVANKENNYTLARSYHERSIALFRKHGDQQNLAVALNNLIDMELTADANTPVAPLLRESIALSQTLQNSRILAHSLALLVGLNTHGNMERGAVLLGGAEAFRERECVPLPPKGAAFYTDIREKLMVGLPQEVFVTALKRGKAMPLADLIDYAFEPY